MHSPNTQLYCDCKDDIERAEFFASGQAHKTGVIARSIAMDVARAFYAKAFIGEITYPDNMTHGQN